MKPSHIPLIVAFIVGLAVIWNIQVQKEEPEGNTVVSAHGGQMEAILNLPTDSPESFALNLSFSNESLLLEFERNKTFGKNTRFLVDDGSGVLKRVEESENPSYVGKVANYPDFKINAVLTKEGLMAFIVRPGEETIKIEPLERGQNLHRISVGDEDSHYKKMQQKLFDDQALDRSSLE